MVDQASNIPVPDPSPQTIDLLRRELVWLRELLETRLNAMDRAFIVFEQNLTRVPTDTDKAVGQLREYLTSKIGAIEAAQRAYEVGSGTALAAAFGAQKEAAAKAEVATGRDIEGIRVLMTQTFKATDERVRMIEGRQDKGEGGSSGKDKQFAAFIAVGAIVVSVVFGGLSYIANRPSAPAQPAVIVQQVPVPAASQPQIQGAR